MIMHEIIFQYANGLPLINFCLFIHFQTMDRNAVIIPMVELRPSHEESQGYDKTKKIMIIIEFQSC